ncbi:MAG: major capsid protein [Acutalibacteraceae bacterium]
MGMTVDLLSSYALNASIKQVSPVYNFFSTRYFPTEEGDIFKADEVLAEYEEHGQKMAPFVAPRVGDIPIMRDGYTMHAYRPPYIAPSRTLTVDDLKKRGFGEALYSNLDASQRAAKILTKDFTDLNNRIARREEWMAVQTMINNGCIMQEYIDANTVGKQHIVCFYNGTSKHTYTVDSSHKWGTAGANIRGDIGAMAKLLIAAGLPASDLVLGTEAADALYMDEELRKAIDLNSGIAVGGINEKYVYPGIRYMGKLNFKGVCLDVFVAEETYQDDNGDIVPYFPAKAAMVTYPGCGHTMYASITQMDYGSTEFKTYAQKRVPKLVVDQDKDIRKIRVATRPLCAPKQANPYIYCAEVV